MIITRGTLRFDDFDSRRFSQIGTLPDPGLFLEDPTGGKTYSYDDPAHVHAVTSLSDGSEYQYDENGNMTCRVEEDCFAHCVGSQWLEVDPHLKVCFAIFAPAAFIRMTNTTRVILSPRRGRRICLS